MAMMKVMAKGVQEGSEVAEEVNRAVLEAAEGVMALAETMAAEAGQDLAAVEMVIMIEATAMTPGITIAITPVKVMDRVKAVARDIKNRRVN